MISPCSDSGWRAFIDLLICRFIDLLIWRYLEMFTLVKYSLFPDDKVSLYWQYASDAVMVIDGESW